MSWSFFPLLPSIFQSLATAVVAFDGFGLDDHGGVTFLDVLARGGHRARRVAGAQRQSTDCQADKQKLFHNATHLRKLALCLLVSG